MRDLQVSHESEIRSLIVIRLEKKFFAGQIWKAHDGIRTRDLFLTKEVLYRLSYMGARRAQPEQSQTIQFPTACNLTPKGLRGAGNGTRTRDPELGRLALYQLSYSRSANIDPAIIHEDLDGGEGRIRTSEGISRQIYSLLPLATREPLPLRFFIPKDFCRCQADGENRTRNILITNQVLYR